MIELKIQFKYFNLEMIIGKKANPWMANLAKADEGERNEPCDLTEESPISTHQEIYFDEYMVDKAPATHITHLAEKYQTELNNQGFPPETKTPPMSTVLDTHTNRADVSSFTPSSISLPENETIAGLYNIGSEEDDLMSKGYEAYPDVEIINDEYEVRLEKVTKLANQRYATYKETHNID